jgi:hypothetical protein
VRFQVENPRRLEGTIESAIGVGLASGAFMGVVIAMDHGILLGVLIGLAAALSGIGLVWLMGWGVNDPSENFAEICDDRLRVRVARIYDLVVPYHEIRNITFRRKIFWTELLRGASTPARGPHVRIECTRWMPQGLLMRSRVIRIAVDAPETFVAELRKRLPERSDGAADDAPRAEPAT